VGFVTQSARFYCRPVRDHSWARYFFVSVDHFVACYRRYSPVRSTTIIQDLLCSLYCLCLHNVFRYCKVKFSGQNYAELALRGIRWFVVRRLMLRYYTPPLLSRFPIIRLYCYSFPSSFFPNLFGRSWLEGCISLPVNLFRVPGYSLVYSKSLGGQLGSNAHGRPFTISGSSSFVSADDVSLVSF
jgi:hypothetical protein